MTSLRNWWLVAAIAVACGWLQTGFAATRAEKQAVRDYLLARGEFPDGLSVDGGIEVAFGKNRDTDVHIMIRVGQFNSFTAQIKDEDGQVLQGQDVELLVLPGGQSVVPFTLMRWQGDDPDAGSVSGQWRGTQIVFGDLFLTRDLPQASRLVVLVRMQQGGNAFRLQTFPFYSAESEYQLVEPVSYEVLETSPPRAKWTLKFIADIPAHFGISWYVTEKYGSASDVTDLRIEAATSTLSILSAPHRTWEGTGCKTLVVNIAMACEDSPKCRTLRRYSSMLIVAPFGDCQAN